MSYIFKPSTDEEIEESKEQYKRVKLFPSLTNLRRESDDIATMPSFTIVEEKSSFLINILQNIENRPKNEVINFIQRNHTSFLNYRLFTESSVSRASIQRAFTSIYFLNILFNCIGTLTLEDYEKYFLNRVAYDYTSLTENKDENVSNLLLQITSYINSNLIIKLSSKLGINEARLLAMISRSIDDEEIRVHRVNRFLVNCDNPRLEAQAMIDIMFFLYDRFMYPIVYTLLEDKSCCKDQDDISQWYNLHKAINAILLSLPSDKMLKVITEYGYIINTRKIPVQVNLKEIQDERLKSVIYKAEESIFIKSIP